jgi:hypothetical protein
VERHGGLDNAGTERPEVLHRRDFISLHQARISHHIGNDDGGKTPLKRWICHLRTSLTTELAGYCSPLGESTVDRKRTKRLTLI